MLISRQRISVIRRFLSLMIYCVVIACQSLLVVQIIISSPGEMCLHCSDEMKSTYNLELHLKKIKGDDIVDMVPLSSCHPGLSAAKNSIHAGVPVQAIVSPFLVDDVRDDVDECNPNVPSGDVHPDFDFDQVGDPNSNFNRLKELDPASANRIHPNDHRKVNRYLNLYASSGVLPSELFTGKIFEKWGRADNLRYDCCFIWVDASLPVLDRYVEQRVDSMMDAGLLAEVCDMYIPNADYTRGLRQAIGVREFEDFLIYYHSNANRYNLCGKNDFRSHRESGIPAKDLKAVLHSDDCNLKILLNEAVDKLKANTRRLVRRQKRRLNRLRTFFGWDLHYIDATEALLCKTDDPWRQQVIDPCVDIIRSFLQEDAFSVTDLDMPSNSNCQVLDRRDLWTQYVCEACGNQILRGAHEWEQHKQGRRHRKRVLQLRRKSQNSSMAD